MDTFNISRNARTEVRPFQLEGLRLIRAASNVEIEQAATFRRDVFLERRHVAFEECLEARRDRDPKSHVFLVLDGSSPVATARVQPYPSELSPVLRLSQGLGNLGADSEVGRIATVQSPLTARYSLIVLTLGAIWLLRNNSLQRYIAYCHPKLVDLYRLVGAEDAGQECIVPGRTDPHRIISGSYKDAAHLGVRLLGVTEAQVCEAIRFDVPASTLGNGGCDIQAERSA